MEKESSQNLFRNPYFLIILLGFLVYLPSLFFNFTYLDDNVLILGNYHFLRNISNIFEAFKQQVFPIQSSPAFYYRPMLTISYMLDAQLGELSLFRYHLTSLIIHLINSCLVFYLLKKLNYKKNISLFFSVIFAIHPVLTQATAWLPGRNDSLLALFVLASFIFFVKFLESEKIKHFLLHVLFFASALFTKEIAIFLPILIIVYFCLIYKEKLLWHHKLKFIFGWIFIFLIWFILRRSALSTGIPKETNIFEMIKSVFAGLPALVQYIGKIIFPFNLSVLPIIKDTTFVYGIIAIILLILGLIFSKTKRFNFIIFGLIWFLMFLLPSFILPKDPAFSDFIEHRLYLPLFGFIIVLLELNLINKLVDKPKKLMAVGVSVIIVFSIITLIHSQNFKNRMNFWQNAVKNSPHLPLAHRNMGAMYYLEGLFDKAETEYKESLELNPYEQMVYNNLGLIYMNSDRFQEAEEEFKKEIEINPYYDTVYYNLGLLYYKQGKFEQAEALWKKTLELSSDYIDAHYALMVFYYEQKDFEKAIFHAQYLQKIGVQLDPEILKVLGL